MKYPAILIRMILGFSFFLLMGCEDSDYEGLKGDFSIRKIPFEYLDCQVTGGGARSGCCLEFYFAIDLKQGILNPEQVTFLDSFAKQIIDTVANKEKYYNGIGILFLRDSKELKSVMPCYNGCYSQTVASEAHRFASYYCDSCKPNIPLLKTIFPDM